MLYSLFIVGLTNLVNINNCFINNFHKNLMSKVTYPRSHSLHGLKKITKQISRRHKQLFDIRPKTPIENHLASDLVVLYKKLTQAYLEFTQALPHSSPSLAQSLNKEFTYFCKDYRQTKIALTNRQAKVSKFGHWLHTTNNNFDIFAHTEEVKHLTDEMINSLMESKRISIAAGNAITPLLDFKTKGIGNSKDYGFEKDEKILNKAYELFDLINDQITTKEKYLKHLNDLRESINIFLDFEKSSQFKQICTSEKATGLESQNFDYITTDL